MKDWLILLLCCTSVSHLLRAEFKMELVGSVLNIFRNTTMLFMLMFKKNSLLTSNTLKFYQFKFYKEKNSGYQMGLDIK